MNESYLQKLDLQINKILNKYIIILLKQIKKVIHHHYKNLVNENEHIYEYLENKKVRTQRDEFIFKLLSKTEIII